MTGPRTSQRYLNGVHVTVYDYDKAGDTLPIHDHGRAPHTEHFVIICRGEFLVLTGSTEAAVEKALVRPGDIVMWPLGTPHGFVARTDNARAMHIRRVDLQDVSLPPGTIAAGVVGI